MISQSIALTDATVFTVSSPFSLGEAESYAAQINFTGGSLVGNLIVQASNDAVNWISITATSTEVTYGISAMFSEGSAQWLYFRIKWTYAAGIGNIGGLIVAKQPERFNR